VSIGIADAQADDWSDTPSISADGRFVAFESDAANLVAGDTNGAPDIFIRDRVAGTTRRVSIGSRGAQADGGSWYPSISAGGRFVAFASYATNLVAGDTNEATDIFIRDRVARETERVSIGIADAQADGNSWYPSISAGGRFVAFESVAANLVAGDTNGAADIFIRDRAKRETERVSIGIADAQADGGSGSPSISAGGRHVAFASWATNLVAGDTNGHFDVFLRAR